MDDEALKTKISGIIHRVHTDGRLQGRKAQGAEAWKAEVMEPIEAILQLIKQDREIIELEARIDECEMAIQTKGMHLISGELVKTADLDGGQPDMISVAAVKARRYALKAQLTTNSEADR